MVIDRCAEILKLTPRRRRGAAVLNITAAHTAVDVRQNLVPEIP
jgi:hypothetical protein